MLIKELTFIFENCEEMTIDGRYIGDFWMKDLTTEISRIACNHVGPMDICRDFFVELHKDANKPYRGFGFDLGYYETTFSRLRNYNDITQVEVTLYDQYSDHPEETETKKHYFLDWMDDDKSENPAQTNYLAATGWLYIRVKDGEDAFSAIGEEVEDEGYADAVSDMYEIGDKYHQGDQENEGKEKV